MDDCSDSRQYDDADRASLLGWTLDPHHLTNFTTLELAPDNLAMVEQVAQIVLQRSNVKRLAVNGSHAETGYFQDQEHEAFVVGLTRPFSGPIVPAIPKTARPSRPILISLHLTDVHLSKVWLERLVGPQLKDLSLKYCVNVDSFLESLLALEDMPIHLESLTVWHQLQAHDQTMVKISALLKKSYGSIRSLELCLRDASVRREPSAINKHRGSLRHFVLDITTKDGPLLWTGKELCTMLEGCEQVSQLALYTGMPCVGAQIKLDECTDRISRVDKFLQSWVRIAGAVTPWYKHSC